MPVILGQAGASLADQYDVAGSIVNISQLNTSEIHLTHELGGVLFAERLGGQILRMDSTPVLQTIAWDIQLTQADLPSSPFRVMGVTVFADVGSRINHATLSMRDPETDQEMPIWVYDQNCSTCGVTTSRFIDDGQAVTQHQILTAVPGSIQVPTMMFGNDARVGFRLPAFAWRGTSLTFGAGLVEAVALIQIAFADQASGLSSHGLPIPSW